MFREPEVYVINAKEYVCQKYESEEEGIAPYYDFFQKIPNWSNEKYS